MRLVGELRPTRLACTDLVHLPSCYNPHQHRTWCLCGAVTWPGRTSTVWRSTTVYDHAGRGALLVGYDTYQLPG